MDFWRSSTYYGLKNAQTKKIEDRTNNEGSVDPVTDTVLVVKVRRTTLIRMSNSSTGHTTTLLVLGTLDLVLFLNYVGLHSVTYI